MNSAWESPCQAHVYVNRRLRWNFFETTLFASSLELPACTATVYGVQKPFITTTSTPDLILAQINDLRIFSWRFRQSKQKRLRKSFEEKAKKVHPKTHQKGQSSRPIVAQFHLSTTRLNRVNLVRETWSLGPPPTHKKKSPGPSAIENSVEAGKKSNSVQFDSVLNADQINANQYGNKQ